MSRSASAAPLSPATVEKRANIGVFFPILEKIFALVNRVTSCVTVKVPKAPQPLACIRRSGITSRSKCASFSISQISCSSAGPRRPAVMMLVLSATGAPVALVNLVADMLGSPICVIRRLGRGSVRCPLALPSRSANHAAEIAAPESRIFLCEHVGLDVAEGRGGLVFDAVVKRLDDVFFELRAARMRPHDGFAFGIAVFGIAQPQHVHLDTGSYEGDDGEHMLRDAWRRVESDRRPDRIDVGPINTATLEEFAGGVCAVDLETLVSATVRRGQAYVVKHRSRVEKFGIELETMVLSRKRTPVIDATRVMEKERRLSVPDKLRDLTHECGVGDADSFDRKSLFSRQCHARLLPE